MSSTQKPAGSGTRVSEKELTSTRGPDAVLDDQRLAFQHSWSYSPLPVTKRSSGGDFLTTARRRPARRERTPRP